MDSFDDVRMLIYDNSDQTEVHMHDFNMATCAVFDWKAHILRGANQDRCKTCVLQALGGTSCLLVLDWAMKLLPMFYRERMSDFFSKHGRSWNVTCVILNKGAKQVECFVHIFDSVTQNWQAVFCLILFDSRQACLRSLTNIMLIFH